MNNEWRKSVVVAAKSAFLLLRISLEAISNDEQRVSNVSSHSPSRSINLFMDSRFVSAFINPLQTLPTSHPIQMRSFQEGVGFILRC